MIGRSTVVIELGGRRLPIRRGIEPRSPLLRTNRSAESFARRVAASGLDPEIVRLDEGESWSSPMSEDCLADGAADGSAAECPPRSTTGGA